MKPIAKLTKRERAEILRDPNARLSDLLEIAALDAIALQKNKSVRFSMSMWVQPGVTQRKCTVCMAGASLFRTLGARQVHNPELLSREIGRNSWRINEARKGGVSGYERDISAVHEALGVVREKLNERSMRAPFRVYLTAARKLRENGL